MEKSIYTNIRLRPEHRITGAGGTRLHAEPGEHLNVFFYKHGAPLGQKQADRGLLALEELRVCSIRGYAESLAPDGATCDHHSSSKNKWHKRNTMDNNIDETLNSINGLQRATAPEGLYDNVLQAALLQQGKLVRMPRPVKRVAYISAAACIVLLAGINIYTLANYGRQQQQKEYNSSAFAGEYFSFIRNI